MVSPKKFTSSTRLYTSSNAANCESSDIPRIDVDSSGSVNFNLDGSLCMSKQGTARSEIKDENWSPTTSEDSSSYLQVIVKKHHGKKDTNVETNAVQTSPPTAAVITSPFKLPTNKINLEHATKDNVNIFKNFDPKNPGIYMMPQPMIFSYPMYEKAQAIDVATNMSPANKPNDKMANGDYAKDQQAQNENVGKNDVIKSIWKDFKWNNDKLQKEAKKIEKTEIYYFEPHSSEHLLTSTDPAPVTRLDGVAARAESLSTKFWAELFSPFYIILSFVTSFVVQLQRFLLVGIFRPLVIDSVQMWSDYGLKPILTLLHNAIIRPPLVFIQNAFISLQHTLRPLARIVADFFKPINNMIRAFRLVNVSKRNNKVSKL